MDANNAIWDAGKYREREQVIRYLYRVLDEHLKSTDGPIPKLVCVPLLQRIIKDISLGS